MKGFAQFFQMTKFCIIDYKFITGITEKKKKKQIKTNPTGQGHQYFGNKNTNDVTNGQF